MKFDALLDINVVAHEVADEVSVLLDLQAPAAPADVPRPPATLQVVLDRSGSMRGEPLDGVKRALIALVRRLDPTDNFGLVTFDETAQIVVPAGPVTDKDDLVRRIASVTTGGSTDLSAGYLRGLREVSRVAAPGIGATLIVVSDGHINAGMRSPDEFENVAAQAYRQGVITTTLGYGRGYDESLLTALARSGSGNHVFADNPDSAGAAIAGEVEGLLTKAAQGVSLTIKLEPAVQFARLFNDLPVHAIGEQGVMVELGDLYANESRRVLLKLSVPALAALGLAQIATLTVSYVAPVRMVEQTVHHPVTVNVVPGDQAAGRVPHPVVVSEICFQEAQAMKKAASEAFERGEHETGKRLLDETKNHLTAALHIADADTATSIKADIEEVERLTRSNDASVTSKTLRESHHRASRKRGRTERPSDGTSAA